MGNRKKGRILFDNPVPLIDKLVEANNRIDELKRQLATVEKVRDHYNAELDADVEHILALAKERDELLEENEQLKRAVAEALPQADSAKAEHKA